MVHGRGIQILGKSICEGIGFQRHSPEPPSHANKRTEFCVDTVKLLEWTVGFHDTL